MTLIEVLAVGSAVILLAGVASPLLVSAKRRAAASAEMSQLHQLAIAQGLYTADTQGIPNSAVSLVQAGYIPPDICASPLDRTERGIANELDDDIGHTSTKYEQLIVPYRSTYVGLREFGFPSIWADEYLRNRPGAGWLASLTTTTHADPEHWNSRYTGLYRRLCLDGSVKVHQHELVRIPSIGKDALAQNNFFLLADGTNEWKRKFISGHP